MKALVTGAGGFIGSHLVKRLKKKGYTVTGIDLKYPEFGESKADIFIQADLREMINLYNGNYDEVYQLAADMGGAGFVFTGEHDADILRNNALININMLSFFPKKIFFSSSACVYNTLNTEESQVKPDSDYGLEKLFSERLYQAYHRNKGIDIRIARFHNIFGPEGTYVGGREKAPAALCRKVIDAQDEIEIWGDGEQTRSFLYIDECLDGVEKLMNSDFIGPVNIGSDELISINDLARMIMEIAGKDLKIKHIEGPLGVRGRNSDNNLVFQKLNWEPSRPLKEGLEKTYDWILKQKESFTY
jgi:GDP-D-mannose 3', 5'-epimerase